MSCAPQNPCHTIANPLVNTVPCTTQLISSSSVGYSGPNLPCTNIQTRDTATVALQKADEQICELKQHILILQQLIQNCCTTTTSSTTSVPPSTSTTTSTSSTSSTTSTTSSTSSSTTSTTSSTSSTSSTTSTTSSTSSTSSTTSTSTSTTTSTTSTTSSTSTTTSTTTLYCATSVSFDVTIGGDVAITNCCDVTLIETYAIGSYTLDSDCYKVNGVVGVDAVIENIVYGSTGCDCPTTTTTTSSSTTTTTTTGYVVNIILGNGPVDICASGGIFNNMYIPQGDTFTTGTVIYQDPGCTNPFNTTLYIYIVRNAIGAQTVYGFDPFTGEILTDTGQGCTF